MYELLQDSKYDDKEITREYIFTADSLTVDEKTNEAQIENMRMEAVKEKRSEKKRNEYYKSINSFESFY